MDPVPVEAPKKCPKCGKPVGATDLSCPQCGADLVFQSPIASKELIEKLPPGGGRPPFFWLGVSLAVLAFLVVVLGLVLWQTDTVPGTVFGGAAGFGLVVGVLGVFLVFLRRDPAQTPIYLWFGKGMAVVYFFAAVIGTALALAEAMKPLALIYLLLFGLPLLTAGAWLLIWNPTLGEIRPHAFLAKGVVLVCLQEWVIATLLYSLRVLPMASALQVIEIGFMANALAALVLLVDAAITPHPRMG